MLIKHATFAVLEAWRGTPERRHMGGLKRHAHRHEFRYEPQEGFIYVRSRAISSRTNDNFDNFPAAELKKAWRTFIGKPVYVNHVNDDPSRARGVIIDAALHEDRLGDGRPDTWVEVLMEVDAIRFPKLAAAILAGEVDRTSMGTNVAYSECSVCGNRASSPLDYCDHIPAMKGQLFNRVTASGKTESHRIYERCFPPGTSVLMGDGVEQPIETITVGSSVIDHLGHPRRVTGVMTNEFDGELVNIVKTGFWKPLGATPEHPILVLRGEATKNGNRQAMATRLRSGRLSPEFIPAREVQPGDYVAEVFPAVTRDLAKIVTDAWIVPDPIVQRDHPEQETTDRYYTPARAWGGRQHILRSCRACGVEMDLYPSEAGRLYCSSKCWGDGYARGNNAHGGTAPRIELPDTIEMDRPFGRWCGWFLAEGSISYQGNRVRPRGVNFGLHEDEIEHIDEILRLGQDLFGLTGSVYRTKNSKGVSVEFFNAPLARLMKVLGENSYTKSVPDEWMSAPIEFIGGLVSAHCDGDGDHQGGRIGGIPDPTIMTHATSSPRLADQLHVMHLMLGHTPTRKTPDPVGRGKRTVPGHHVRVPTTCDSKGRMTWGPWVFSHVKAVSVSPYVGSVYNLEVEGTHTYVANHVAVHNCYGLSFFENSILVEDPADPTAAFTAVDDRGLGGGYMGSLKTAAARTAAKYTYRPDEARRATAHLWEDGWWQGLDNPLIREVKKRKGWVLDDDQSAQIWHSNMQGSVWVGSSGIDATIYHADQRIPLKIYANVKTAMDAIERYIRKYAYSEPDWGPPLVRINTGGTNWERRPLASRRTASRRHGYGEQVAPAQIDTLRAEKCPNCGEAGAYSGTECAVCGFITPPSQFMDPDLDAAGEIDRIQDDNEDSALQVDDGDDEMADADTEPGGDGQLPVEIDDGDGDDLPIDPDDNLPGDDSPEINQYDFPRMEKTDEESDLSDVDIDADAEDPDLEDDFENTLDEEDETDDPDLDDSIDGEDEAVMAEPDADPESDEDEDDESDDLDPKKKRSAAMAQPRPTFNALVALRIRQEASLKAITRIARATGVDISDITQESAAKLGRLGAQQRTRQAARPIAARPAPRQPKRPAGRPGRPTQAQAAQARMRRRSDVNNPAQPWPEDGATGADLEPMPGASENLETPGLGTTIDTSADATDTPTSIGTTLEDSGPDATGDVTDPVAGATEQRPESETITLPEAEYRDLDAEGAFPVEFSESDPQTVQAIQNRMFAATRLARLRIEAGLAQGDDISLGQVIAQGNMSTREIAAEIRTITAMSQVRQPVAPARGRVLAQAQPTQRSTPSFGGAPAVQMTAVVDDDLSDIFLGDVSSDYAGTLHVQGF